MSWMGVGGRGYEDRCGQNGAREAMDGWMDSLVAIRRLLILLTTSIRIAHVQPGAHTVRFPLFARVVGPSAIHVVGVFTVERVLEEFRLILEVLLLRLK